MNEGDVYSICCTLSLGEYKELLTEPICILPRFISNFEAGLEFSVSLDVV